MKDKSKKGLKLTRRNMLPLLGSSLLIPFLGFANPSKDKNPADTEEKYQTLLKPDGTAVKVKISAIKKSKTLQKNVSNKSLLNWLGRKL